MHTSLLYLSMNLTTFHTMGIGLLCFLIRTEIDLLLISSLLLRLNSLALKMYILSQGVNPLSSSLWAHVLQTRDLVVLQKKSSGFEVCSPHFLARQFGLLQSVPPIFTANVPWHRRSMFTNEEAEVIIVEGISKITAAKVEPFRIVSDALPLFNNWWEALMLSFNTLEILKLTIWEICPSCLAFEIFGKLICFCS